MALTVLPAAAVRCASALQSVPDAPIRSHRSLGPCLGKFPEAAGAARAVYRTRRPGPHPSPAPGPSP
uniref:Putative secreted protein n=1 Tax=Anopheles triannulatus TaxID=58253 RepID=A0A2M4B7Q9_9DIPT